MKFLISALLFLVISLTYKNNAVPISDYQIRLICRKEKRRSKCIEELKIKRLNLIQGKQIEIPVVPFKE